MTESFVNSAMADALAKAGKIKTNRKISKKHTRPTRVTKYWTGTLEEAQAVSCIRSADTYDSESYLVKQDTITSYTSDANSVTYDHVLEFTNDDCIVTAKVCHGRNGSIVFTCDNSNIRTLRTSTDKLIMRKPVITQRTSPVEFKYVKPEKNACSESRSIWSRLANEMVEGNIPQGPMPYTIWTTFAPHAVVKHRFAARKPLQDFVNEFASSFDRGIDSMFIATSIIAIDPNITLLLSGAKAHKTVELRMRNSSGPDTIIRMCMYLRLNK